MPPAPRFRVDRAEAVALLRIDNPPRNLLTLSMVADLAALVAELEKDDSVRSAVVTGEGPAHFSTRACRAPRKRDRKSTRLNSSHGYISYAVFCLKKKKKNPHVIQYYTNNYQHD